MNRIKEHRERVGLSKPELARRVGVDTRTITRWEKNELKRGLATRQMQALADILGCGVEHIMGPEMIREAEADVAPFPRSSHAAAIARRGLKRYKVLTDVVSEAGVAIGDEITVEETANAIKEAVAGDILLLRSGNPSFLMLRQFLPPALFTTNRRNNDHCFHLSDRRNVLGVVIRAIDEASDE